MRWLWLLAVGCAGSKDPADGSCPWEGVRDITDVSCDGLVMDEYLANPRPVATFEAGGAGESCLVSFLLQRLDEFDLCEVSETIELTHSGGRWSGESVDGSDSPAGCFGSAPAGLPLGEVSVEALPEGPSLSFGDTPPWSLSECEGTAALRFGS